MPGEKVIVQEDFSQDELGGFPAKWNTNPTGELVNGKARRESGFHCQKMVYFCPNLLRLYPKISPLNSTF